MKRISLLAAPFAAAVMATAGFSGSSSASAVPSPPSGYHETYSHNFATQGMGNWVTQPYGTASVSDSSSGLGIRITGEGQWSEVVSSTTVSPGSFIQAYVYLPASGGLITNWPAFWTTGPNWPAGGEIDLAEGLGGYACYHVHSPAGGPGGCAQKGQFTGWVTLSALWASGEVTFWYNSTLEGTEPLTTTASQELIFQDQSYTSYSSCPSCFGPYSAGTAYLGQVTVYQSAGRR